MPGSEAPGEGPSLVRRGYNLPSDLVYKLRVAAARRDGVREVDIVRQAVAAHLDHDLEEGRWEPLLLRPELVERLSQTAAGRGTTPEHLLAYLVTEALDLPVETE